MYITQDLIITDDIWMIITEDMMTCTDMTGDMIEGMTETDIINIRIVTDTADVRIQSGGYFGLSSSNKNN
ncbi:MAG TPA: hypothetical protein DHU59_12495 [Clostridiales bacterium]|nr:hypothetical protein [Clostridiales bacterium]